MFLTAVREIRAFVATGFPSLFDRLLYISVFLPDNIVVYRVNFLLE
jgi:hypothetical protein